MSRKFLSSKYLSPNNLKNYFLDDPLLDYLKYFNITSLSQSPLQKITRKRASYNQDNTTSNLFTQFIINQGNNFETEIITQIKNKYPNDFIEISSSYTRNREYYNQTINAINNKIPIIYQGVLINESNQTFGCPDLLIRNDFLLKLFPNIINNIKNDNNYSVVDIKFHKLHLNCDGQTLRNEGLIPFYKGQLLLYMEALNSIQNNKSNQAFILGNGFHYQKNRDNFESNEPFDKLGVIDYKDKDNYVYQKLDNAIKWLRKLHQEGSNWKLLPEPSMPELYPNMCNKYDGYYHELKVELAEKLKELTLIWNIGVKNRYIGFDNKIYHYNDNKFDATLLGFPDKKRAKVINQIQKVNISNDLILPKKITNNLYNWKKEIKECYIDFETINKIDKSIPNNGYIFMIGLGYLENDKWVFKNYYLKELNDESELIMINQFYQDYISLGNKIRAFHWSHAEITFWNKALEKHHLNLSINFIDLLKIFLDEPISVKGSFNYSLKSIGNALYQNKLIDLHWNENNPCCNGLTAMIMAFKQYQSKKIDETVFDMIKDYNEIDCLMMYKIINLLRKNYI